MYKTPSELGLSHQEINRISEELWIKYTKGHETRQCPDCGVMPGNEHKDGCDIARCLICGGQKLGCDCISNNTDVWTGIYPGIRECYNQKLICQYGDNEWTFDLNSYYSNL